MKWLTTPSTNITRDRAGIHQSNRTVQWRNTQRGSRTKTSLRPDTKQSKCMPGDVSYQLLRRIRPTQTYALAGLHKHALQSNCRAPCIRADSTSYPDQHSKEHTKKQIQSTSEHTRARQSTSEHTRAHQSTQSTQSTPRSTPMSVTEGIPKSAAKPFMKTQKRTQYESPM